MDLRLQLSSGCNVTDPLVKEEDIKEEEYDHMISCQDEEEKPNVAELHCKSETDTTEFNVTNGETLHTDVKKKEEEEEQEVNLKTELDGQEYDYLLESSSGTQTTSGTQTGVETEVKTEEEEHDSPLESVSEHPHLTQQKIRGQNAELNLQVNQQTDTLSSTRKETTGKKDHKCENCGITFTTSSYLRRHMLTHSRKSCHNCEQCGKSYSRPSRLKAHMLVHSGKKPHKCVRCGKAFPLGLSLKKEGYSWKESNKGRKSSSLEDLPQRLTERHFLYKADDHPDCVVCSDRTRPKGRRQTKYRCRQCGVGVCVVPCNERYHTKKHYKKCHLDG
ncbi:zinc finger protein 493-like isoform X3 [Sardina pilchardus]|uniref:zinc finger protein 493-like isoform X3 n=1 Tax=Sardina pilchardus TaxID=27697 RepID=UPI002E0F272A